MYQLLVNEPLLYSKSKFINVKLHKNKLFEQKKMRGKRILNLHF